MGTGKHQFNQVNDTRSGEVAVSGAALQQPVFKISFRNKALAFIGTTVALSWFFEGWREINSNLTPAHVFVIVAGTALTLALLAVQGYWIYIEEKLRGTLKKRIGFYENIYARSELSKRISGQSGEES